MRQLVTSTPLQPAPAGAKLLKPVAVATIAGTSLLLWAAILVPFLA